MSKQREEDKLHVNLAWIIRTVIVIIGILIIGMAVFFVFRTRTEANQCLREAKNILIALQTTEIEYYAQEKTIYDPTRLDGLSKGVKDSVNRIVDTEGYYQLLRFDTKKHEIISIRYTNGPYEVDYYNAEGRKIWEVKYKMQIYRYDGTETKPKMN